MQPRPNHAQEEVRPVIFQRSAKNLLVNWNGASTLDATKSVDCCPYAQFANTLNVNRDFCLRGRSLWIALCRYLCKSDANGTNITTKNIATIESFSCSHCIIQTLEIDYGDEC